MPCSMFLKLNFEIIVNMITMHTHAWMLKGAISKKFSQKTEMKRLQIVTKKKKEIFLFMKSWALRVSFEGNEVSTGGYKYVYFLFKEIQVSRETCLQSRTISIFSLHSFFAISWLAFLFCLNETRLPNFLLTHIFQFLFRHFSNFFVAMLKM